MKLILVVLCVVALAFAKDKYEDIENNFNIEELLGNDRLLTAYIKCLLNKGPCTPEVKKIKGMLFFLFNLCTFCSQSKKKYQTFEAGYVAIG